MLASLALSDDVNNYIEGFYSQVIYGALNGRSSANQIYGLTWLKGVDLEN